jgi:hypothetical protein
MKDYVLNEKPEPASSRQFGILATAGFDLGTMKNLFN